MHKLAFYLLPCLLLFACQSNKQEQFDLNYPEAHKVDTVDNYFGTQVKDPYRWMENLDSDTLEHWIQKENEIFDGYMEHVGLKDTIQSQLSNIWDYPKYSSPFRTAKHYFYFKNSGLKDHSVLYKLDSLHDEPEVFLDPNTFSEDGTVALSNTQVSNNGKYMAYSISKSGSDWKELYVKNIQSGKKLDDHLKWIKFSGISWKGDGFYYSRYDAPEEDKHSKQNKFHKVYYHKLGQPQNRDRLVYQDQQNPLRNFFAQTTEDERFLIISASEGASGNNALYVKDLRNPGRGFTKIIKHFNNSYSVIGNMNGKLLVKTNQNAPKNKLVKIDPKKPDTSNWQTLVPQQEEVMQSASLAGGHILTKYMKDASSLLKVYHQDGSFAHQVGLPTIGSVSGFSGRKQDTVVHFSFQSFNYPNTIYSYNIRTNETVIFREFQLDMNPNDYITKQVFYESEDGTEIPMFIVHKRGIDMDGKNPCLLYGYGGFNISLNPEFDISRFYFLQNGGVFAMPNLRGGGEYGEKWHKEGMLDNKQNVFDDFIHAAKYLFKKGYTNKDQIAISGRSNGGLLVGATMIQKPEMFEVALPAVGVMDMLRYHKFTIGWAWASEYGTSDDSTQFQYLYDYSPYHNLKKGTCYPATLVTTADHDDRVVPAHSFKFTARLQEYQSCDNPTLISIETKAGHGAGKPVSKTIKQQAEKWAFTFDQLGMEP